jgi:hypothetical protein
MIHVIKPVLFQSSCGCFGYSFLLMTCFESYGNSFFGALSLRHLNLSGRPFIDLGEFLGINANRNGSVKVRNTIMRFQYTPMNPKFLRSCIYRSMHFAVLAV